MELTQAAFDDLRRSIHRLCRNVLIYFDEATRRTICGQFHAMLADGGWLLLGSAENLYGVSEQFASVHFGDTLVYHKRQVVGIGTGKSQPSASFTRRSPSLAILDGQPPDPTIECVRSRRWPDGGYRH
jgi:hypothetical protein